MSSTKHTLVSHELPRSQLPSWPRPSLIDQQSKGAKIRQLPRDQKSPVEATRRIHLERTMSLMEGPVKGNVASQERILMLERSMSFLRSQHSDTLMHLHKEIERLKGENKELNFKLVMCQCGQNPNRSVKSRQSRRKTSEIERQNTEDEPRPFLLEEEVRNLKNSLQNERRRTSRLMKVIEQRMQRSLDQPNGDSEICSPNIPSYLLTGDKNPTLDECKDIIVELQAKTQQQSHELTQLKADLQDLLYSDKWTPDAYLIARAYVPEDEDKHTQSPQYSTDTGPILPEITGKRKENVKEKAYRRVHESVHLPALRPRLPNPISERHRRAISLQRTRLGTFPRDQYY